MTFVAERQAREERQNIHEATKPLVEKLNAGTRLTVEERTELQGRQAEIQKLTEEIRTYEQARELAAASAPVAPEVPGVDPVEARERDFSAWLKRGVVTPELRAAGEATNSAGGFLVPPGWWQRLQVAMKAYGGIANDFTPLVTESGQPMQWATVDPTTTVGQLVGSATTTGGNSQTPGSGSGSAGGNENFGVGDLDYVFGQGTMNAYMFTSGVQKISIQLANDSAFDTDTFVRDRVGEALGRALAQYAISGSGSSQPLGIITALGAKGGTNAAATGTAPVSMPKITSQSGGYVNLGLALPVPILGGTSSTAPGNVTELNGNLLSFATVLAMIQSVDKAYRGLGASWYMNDAQVLGMMSVTDFFGHPLWQPSPIAGEPDRLYNYPIVVDNNIPNLAASTAGGPVFGHLASAMVHRTVNQSGLMRLDERYADLLQVGYIGYMRFDIRSNDLRAAVTVKPGAS